MCSERESCSERDREETSARSVPQLLIICTRMNRLVNVHDGLGIILLRSAALQLLTPISSDVKLQHVTCEHQEQANSIRSLSYRICVYFDLMT